ncbi:MAG: hypothetical protein K0S41_472 [Anaerocolumna sp.]|jgi:hypothetical protein|nr:hypothetical protein [Anaerocolumna sp.]
MIVHQVFAQIVDTEIRNIIVADNYELANQLSRMIYGDTGSALECTQYPVSIGDKCIDRVFYFKDGLTPVPRKNTAEEDSLVAKTKVDYLVEHQSDVELDIDYRLSMIELGLV